MHILGDKPWPPLVVYGSKNGVEMLLCVAIQQVITRQQRPRRMVGVRHKILRFVCKG